MYSSSRLLFLPVCFILAGLLFSDSPSAGDKGMLARQAARTCTVTHGGCEFHGKQDGMASERVMFEGDDDVYYKVQRRSRKIMIEREAKARP